MPDSKENVPTPVQTKKEDNMKYIVFLKQVPRSTKVKIDPVTRTLQRSSALSQTNPDDLYALEAALSLKKETKAEVIAISMGPSSAEAVLRDALQRGADRLS